MALKTNYKDDVFTGQRKYNLVENEDGTVSPLDVTQYSQEGDYFGAADMNATNTEVNSIRSTVNSNTSNLNTLQTTVSGHTTSINNLSANKADKTQLGTKITARLSGTTLYLTF